MSRSPANEGQSRRQAPETRGKPRQNVEPSRWFLCRITDQHREHEKPRARSALRVSFASRARTPAPRAGRAERRLTERPALMANVSLRKEACNQLGPAGSFLTRDRSLPTTNRRSPNLEPMRGSRSRQRPAEEGPKPAPYRPLERAPSYGRSQSTTTTAFTSSQ